MLIDSTHKRWFLTTLTTGAAAAALYHVLARRSPNGLTGGSTVGLWYGLVGCALLLYAALLAAHRRLPARWGLGPRRLWLRGHLWLGALCPLFLICHSGGRWGGPLEQLLWLALIGVLVTGALGVLLQQILPRQMSLRLPREAPYEQIPQRCRLMRRRADALVDSLCGPPPTMPSHAPPGFEDGRVHLRDFYERDLRPFLAEQAIRSPLTDPQQTAAVFGRLALLPGMNSLRDQLDQLQSLCDERRQLAVQDRLHFWLHAWLTIHVPLAAALLVLAAAHIATALYH